MGNMALGRMNTPSDVTKMDIMDIKKMDAMAYARTLFRSKKPKDYPPEIRAFLAALEKEVVQKSLLTPLKDDAAYSVVGQGAISSQDNLRRLALAAQALYFCSCSKKAYNINLDPKEKIGDSDVIINDACVAIRRIGESVAKQFKLRITSDTNLKTIIDSDKKVDPWKISEEGPRRDNLEARGGNAYAGARLGRGRKGPDDNPTP